MRPRLAALISVAVAGMVLATAGPAATSSPGLAASSESVQPGDVGVAADVTTLGGINLNAYCRSQGFQDAVRDSSSQSGWACHLQGRRTALSITAACRFQYVDLVNRGFIVVEDPGNNVTDRKCQAIVNTRINRGGMDLTGYCRYLGFSRAFNEGGSLDGWYCDNGNADIRIDLNKACQWRNPLDTANGYVVVAVYANIGAAFRIGCVALI